MGWVFTTDSLEHCKAKYACFAPCTKIKKIDNKIKVLFVTAFEDDYEVLKEFLLPVKVADINDEELAAVLVEVGGRFNRKPIDIDDLAKRVKAELR